MINLNSLINKDFTEISFSILRLSRLLHKHRFAEAESFAIQFGLDVEVIMNSFVHQTSVSSCSRETGETECKA